MTTDRLGADIEFVESDMRRFELVGRFGLVFVARNSLLHLHTAVDFAAAFATVRRHLAPGAVFAFDVFNPDVRLLARPAEERTFVMRATREPYGELTVEATSDYYAATQVNRATWYMSTPKHPDRWVMPLHLRSIFPEELPLLLAASGFHLRSREGTCATARSHRRVRARCASVTSRSRRRCQGRIASCSPLCHERLEVSTAIVTCAPVYAVHTPTDPSS